MPEAELKAFIQMESDGCALRSPECPLPGPVMTCSKILTKEHGNRTLKCCYFKEIKRVKGKRVVVCRSA